MVGDHVRRNGKNGGQFRTPCIFLQTLLVVPSQLLSVCIVSRGETEFSCLWTKKDLTTGRYTKLPNLKLFRFWKDGPSWVFDAARKGRPGLRIVQVRSGVEAPYETHNEQMRFDSGMDFDEPNEVRDSWCPTPSELGNWGDGLGISFGRSAWQFGSSSQILSVSTVGGRFDCEPN